MPGKTGTPGHRSRDGRGTPRPTGRNGKPPSRPLPGSIERPPSTIDVPVAESTMDDDWVRRAPSASLILPPPPQFADPAPPTLPILVFESLPNWTRHFKRIAAELGVSAINARPYKAGCKIHPRSAKELEVMERCFREAAVGDSGITWRRQTPPNEPSSKKLRSPPHTPTDTVRESAARTSAPAAPRVAAPLPVTPATPVALDVAQAHHIPSEPPRKPPPPLTSTERDRESAARTPAPAAPRVAAPPSTTTAPSVAPDETPARHTPSVPPRASLRQPPLTSTEQEGGSAARMPAPAAPSVVAPPSTTSAAPVAPDATQADTSEPQERQRRRKRAPRHLLPPHSRRPSPRAEYPPLAAESPNRKTAARRHTPPVVRAFYAAHPYGPRPAVPLCTACPAAPAPYSLDFMAVVRVVVEALTTGMAALLHEKGPMPQSYRPPRASCHDGRPEPVKVRLKNQHRGSDLPRAPPG